MRIPSWIIVGMCMAMSIAARSQTPKPGTSPTQTPSAVDTIRPAPPVKPPTTAKRKKVVPPKPKPNTTSLELVYKNALITQYNSYGGRSTYNVFVPFVRVNGEKPVEIGKRAEFLRSFYSRCSDADQQIDLMLQENRRAKTLFWSSMGVGTAIFIRGLIKTGQTNTTGSGLTQFYVHAGLGSLVMLGGTYLAHLHAKKADEHLRLSVDVYNERCFKPLPADTNKPAAVASAPPPPSTEASPPKLYEDTYMYTTLRNEPTLSNLVGIMVNPLIVNGSSFNFNLSIGCGVFYTIDSKYCLSATYQQAYLDDLLGSNRGGPPGGDADDYGAPVKLSKSSLLEFQTKTSVATWEEEDSYHLKLGHEKIGHIRTEVIGKAKGKILKAVTARLGYQIDNRLVESESGIQYANGTPAYQYHYGSQVYTLTPANLASSSSMVKSNVITAGIGLSSFRDLKIELQDDTYKGKREEKSQTDLFLDLMYAYKMDVQDIIYYHPLLPVTNEDGHLPQRLDVSGSPVNRIGFRMGMQSLSMYSPHFGTRTLLEAGIRPGPKGNGVGKGLYLQLTFGIIFGARRDHE